MPSPDARVAIVTGVSRRAGIGFAIARRLIGDGHRVLVHSWSAVDHEHGLAEPDGMTGALRELGGEGEHLAHVEADLSEADACAAVVDAAVDAFGAVDVLVVNHAFSPSDRLDTTTAELLDRTWRTNARAAVLLAQAFARRYDERRGDGRIVLFTSGQHRERMPAGRHRARGRVAVLARERFGDRQSTPRAAFAGAQASTAETRRRERPELDPNRRPTP